MDPPCGLDGLNEVQQGVDALAGAAVTADPAATSETVTSSSANSRFKDFPPPNRGTARDGRPESAGYGQEVDKLLTCYRSMPASAVGRERWQRFVDSSLIRRWLQGDPFFRPTVAPVRGLRVGPPLDATTSGLPRVGAVGHERSPVQLLVD